MNVFTANASRLSQSKNSDGVVTWAIDNTKKVIGYGNTVVNWALDKVRVTKSGTSDFDIKYVGSDDEAFQSEEEKADTQITDD